MTTRKEYQNQINKAKDDIAYYTRRIASNKKAIEGFQDKGAVQILKNELVDLNRQLKAAEKQLADAQKGLSKLKDE
jgi:predicted  nucleic acid-binding Zn-ribbon protein